MPREPKIVRGQFSQSDVIAKAFVVRAGDNDT